MKQVQFSLGLIKLSEVQQSVYCLQLRKAFIDNISNITAIRASAYIFFL